MAVTVFIGPMWRSIICSIAVVCCCLAGCGDTDDGKVLPDTADTLSADTISASDPESDTLADTMDVSAITQCGTLFGVPGEQTGLSDAQCKPVCTCGDTFFASPQLTAAQLDRLATVTLLNPPELLSANPYASGRVPVDGTADAVCAVTFSAADANTYRLDTFVSEAAAVTAGAVVTHYGACGMCSALADLAVYMRIPDLTGPVRECGIEGMMGGESANLDCLKALGFTDACAQIWYFNTLNTRTVCLETCATRLADPYHLPSGEINACLQCDEDNSGPIFKSISGRTRRNSGLPSAICRPCETVQHVTHNY